MRNIIGRKLGGSLFSENNISGKEKELLSGLPDKFQYVLFYVAHKRGQCEEEAVRILSDLVANIKPEVDNYIEKLKKESIAT